MLSHVALKVDHFTKDAFVIAFEAANVGGHFVLGSCEPVDLGLEGLDNVRVGHGRGRVRGGGEMSTVCVEVGVGGSLGGDRLALGGDLALDVFEGITTIGLKVGMAKCPTVVAKGVFLVVLDLVKVILVELADEAGEIGVLEHAGEDRFCELGHVLERDELDEQIKTRAQTLMMKQSPPGPQQTTSAKVLSWSILAGDKRRKPREGK